MKTLLKILGGLIGLILAAIIIIPFVVDVDKYRPMIIEQAGNYINGKLEIGKLSLSLWGTVKVKIDGVKLSDTKGNSVLEVKDAAINLPFAPILTGAPELRVEFLAPMINVVKARDGKMNVMSLMKEQAPAAAPGNVPGMPNLPAKQQATAAGGKTEIPAIAMKARLTFLIDNAKLAYKDELTGDSYNINDLAFHMRDVSLEHEIPYELIAQLDLTTMKTIKIKGPLVFDGSIKAIQENGAFARANAKASLKLDGLDISYPGMFEKKAGVPLGFTTEITASKTELKMPSFKFVLADVIVDSKLDVKVEAMDIDFKLLTNTIDIAKLGALVPMIHQYGLNGSVNLDASAKGPTSKLDYTADVKLDKVTLTHESMRQPLHVSANIAVVTNKLKEADLKLNAKDFDLLVKGSLEDFAKPRFAFDVLSNNMDVDGLMKASEKAAETRKAEAAATNANPAAATAKSTAPPVDYDAMFEPLRKNPMLAGINGKVAVDLKHIKSTGVSIDEMKLAFVMDGLAMALKGISMRIFGGSIKGEMTFDAKSAKPVVGTNLVVDSLSTQKMVESQMPFAKNTIKGIISSKLNIGGPGLNPDEVMQQWKGNGEFSVKNAMLATMDFGPQIRKGITEKLPGPAKDKVKIPPSIDNWKGEYDTILMKFALDKGTFFMNEIVGKAVPNKGMDMQGSGKVQLKDFSENIEVDFIDRYSMIPQISKYAADKRYGGKATIPAVIGCTALSPCFDFTKAVTIIAKNAIMGGAAEKVISKLPPQAQGALNKILGGGSGGGGAAPAAPAPAAPKQEDVKKALKGIFGH